MRARRFEETEDGSAFTTGAPLTADAASGIPNGTQTTAGDNVGDVVIASGANANISGGALPLSGENVLIAQAIALANGTAQNIDIDAVANANATVVLTTAAGAITIAAAEELNPRVFWTRVRPQEPAPIPWPVVK